MEFDLRYLWGYIFYRGKFKRSDIGSLIFFLRFFLVAESLVFFCIRIVKIRIIKI